MNNIITKNEMSFFNIMISDYIIRFKNHITINNIKINLKNDKIGLFLIKYINCAFDNYINIISTLFISFSYIIDNFALIKIYNILNKIKYLDVMEGCVFELLSYSFSKDRFEIVQHIINNPLKNCMISEYQRFYNHIREECEMVININNSLLKHIN